MRAKRPRYYEVESIVDSRRVGARRRLFRVRWAGYGMDADTWEPERQLREDGVGELIQKYYALEMLMVLLRFYAHGG